ncbi:MAG TPA: NlpC/P60 family protein [Bacteroidia bacterium]|nr:NlpC/P60 family protein [Bacteroidia bacterium]
MASCKSKKTIATNNPTKQKTEVAKNPTDKITLKEEVKSQEASIKISTEEIKTETKNISDKTLVNFISDWYGTTYKYGGADKHGIDCSHFAARLYADVYKKTITGPSNAIEQETINVKTTDMQEGDLLFFKINGDKVSHVGVYLGNNKFVHASTKRGVIISDLNEPYYKKYFYKAGKLK